MAETHRKIVFAALEPSYGGSVTLTQAIACRVRDYDAWVAEARQKQNVQNHSGSQLSNTVSYFSSITLEVDLAGSGTAGTESLDSMLFKACKRSVTEDAGTDTVIALDDSSTDSIRIGLHVDNFFFEYIGVRGNVSFEFNAKGMPMAVFSLVGIPLPVANASLPAVPDMSGFLEPVAINDANTTFTVWGFAAVLKSLSFDDGHNVQRRDNPNDKAVLLRERQSSGSISFELPNVGSKDFMGLIRTDNTDALQLIVGTSAGNIMQLDMPRVQLLNPKPAEPDGSLHITADMNILPTAGTKDTESTFTWT